MRKRSRTPWPLAPSSHLPIQGAAAHQIRPTRTAASTTAATVTKENPPAMGTPRQHLTIAALCEELEVSRTTFYAWRVKGRAPRCIKLPNGEIRIRRADLESWLSDCEEEAA